MAKRERISSVDTAWLRMDRPTNLMMIVGVMMFDAPLPFERLQRTIESRLLAYRRFRQKAVQEATGSFWEDDDLFNLEFHLQRTALPAPGGKRELQHYVAELAASPLDPSKPLWHFQLVENFDGGSALIVRIHHSIADGIALTGVMMDLTDETPDAADPAPRARRPRRTVDAVDDDDSLWSPIVQPLSEAVAASFEVSGAIWSKYIKPALNADRILDYAKIGGAVAGELAYLATMADDSVTRFKGKPGVSKRVAWSEPLPLAEIKAAGKVLGCSVNDLLLSSVAGALRGYLLDKGESADGVDIRALVPVNLRPPERHSNPDKRLGNRFGLVTLLLPVGMENPLARLFQVRQRMERLKGSYQAPVTLGILGVVGMAPRVVQQQILDMLAAKATAVMTNVPGPQQPRYLAGARLKQMMFWVPQSGDIGMGVSILSYDGRVQFGLLVDRKRVDDPEQIVNRFRPEFDKVLYAVLLEPWPEGPIPEEAEVAAPANENGARKRKAMPRSATPRTSLSPKTLREPGADGAAAPSATAAGPAGPPKAPRIPKRFR